MTPRMKRGLLGCGGGCLALALLAIGGCVAFNLWVHAPGELLEPQQLLDPQAVGYLEGRLELDNPGTEAFFDAFVQLLRAEQPPVPSPLLRSLMEWNRTRQERDMRRLFPTHLVWTFYPAEDAGDTASILSVSVQHANHQLIVADWLLGLLLPLVDEVPVLRHRGEQIVVIDTDERHAGPSPESSPEAAGSPPADGLPPRFYCFLRGDGFFLATAEAPARRAVDRLTASVPGGDAPSPLADLVDGVPGELQLRGAFLNPRGELASLAGRLLQPLATDDPEAVEALRRALATVTAATVGGGFEPSGDVRLELELRGSPPELEPALAAVLGALAAEVPLEWDSRPTDTGLAVSLRMRDVPRLIRESIDERREQPRPIGPEAGADRPR